MMPTFHYPEFHLSPNPEALESICIMLFIPLIHPLVSDSTSFVGIISLYQGGLKKSKNVGSI